jgi:putative AlgH/UPF0301 family transcriptional regulator
LWGKIEKQDDRICQDVGRCCVVMLCEHKSEGAIALNCSVIHNVLKKTLYEEDGTVHSVPGEKQVTEKKATFGSLGKTVHKCSY